ncbi:hypothetical protein INR49_027865, partial [Caranx melampygus]
VALQPAYQAAEDVRRATAQQLKCVAVALNGLDDYSPAPKMVRPQFGPPHRMEMVMALGLMKGVTTQIPEAEEMRKATQLRGLLTGENPEVEDDPQLSRESPDGRAKGATF